MEDIKTAVYRFKAAYIEVEQLLKETDTSDIQNIIENSTLTLNGAFVHNDDLYRILRSISEKEEFFGAGDNSGLITIELVQLLAIHFSIQKDRPKLDSIPQIRSYIQNSFKHKSLFIHWHERGKLIVYLEYIGHTRWQKLMISCDDNGASRQLLEGSITYCNINADDIFKFIHIVKEKSTHPSDLYSFGTYLIAKIESDKKIRNEIEGRLSEIFANENLKLLLPSFLKGLVAEDTDIFSSLLNELPEKFDEKHQADVITALTVACPNNKDCLIALKAKLDQLEKTKQITGAQYIHAFVIRNFGSNDIQADMEQRAAAVQNPQELLELLQYLLGNLASHKESWFNHIAQHIVVTEDINHVGLLNHFFYMLSETNPELVYELQTLRFSKLGNEKFLTGFWHELIAGKPGLFQTHLTLWLKSGTPNIYRAILKLCSIHEIEEKYFVLSQKELKQLSSSDKLFIGIKIAGYVYAKDQLQSLLFSLVISIRPKERKLMEELFNIFYNYVIYNYRSTLETIKQLLQQKKLPKHLHDFYHSLDHHYELYFENLRKIRDYNELRPDNKLAEHLRFYTQEKFKQEFKKAREPGWLAGIKETPIHSKRWAIRRPTEKVHQVTPLGVIETSTEFPSGERLNPVFQETLRRSYQRIKRNEINID